MPIDPVRVDVTVDGDPVPALVFVPRSASPLPLVLFGHGAHLSKDDEVMQILARAIARGVPAGVVLMDCPGHGDRRAPALTDEAFGRDVARRMSDPAGDAGLIADWEAIASAARTRVPVLSGPLAYVGFSMGALFGLSIVADMPDVRAAVFALGGLVDDDAFGGGDGGTARNARVRDAASRLGDREVLMLNMTRDEHFPIVGAIEVLETIPGPKRMAVWAGTHVDIPPEAVTVANQFLARTLTP
jgi:dienelactone hydrolase